MFEKPISRVRPQTPKGKNDETQLHEKRIDLELQKDARVSRVSRTPDKKRKPVLPIWAIANGLFSADEKAMTNLECQAVMTVAARSP